MNRVVLIFMKSFSVWFSKCLCKIKTIQLTSEYGLKDFVFKFFSLLTSLLLISGSFAANGFPGTGGGVLPTDWVQMLQNFASQFPDIEQLVTAAAYVLGFVFVVRAIYYLKIYGELRTMMSSNASLRPPLTYLLVGVAFIYLPTTIDVVLATVYNTSEVTPISYSSDTGGVAYGEAIRVFYMFIQLIGYIAFIRGWIIISHTAQQTGRETVGKGIVHIIGGILAINVVETKDILWNTFGFPTS